VERVTGLLWTIAGLAAGIVVVILAVAALIVWLAHYWRG
jgi:hypothetical protein